MSENGERKGKKIYNSATQRWLVYGSPTFLKWLNEGSFDTVLSEDELIRFGRMTWRRKIKSTPSHLVPPDVRGSILSFVPKEKIKYVTLSSKHLPNDVLLHRKLNLNDAKMCKLLKDEDFEILLKNPKVHTLDVYRCALIAKNEKTIKKLSQLYSLNKLLKYLIKNKVFGKSDVKIFTKAYKERGTLKVNEGMLATIGYAAKEDKKIYEYLVSYISKYSLMEIVAMAIKYNPYRLDNNDGAEIVCAIFSHYCVKYKSYNVYYYFMVFMHRAGDGGDGGGGGDGGDGGDGGNDGGNGVKKYKDYVIDEADRVWFRDFDGEEMLYQHDNLYGGSEMSNEHFIIDDDFPIAQIYLTHLNFVKLYESSGMSIKITGIEVTKG